MDETSSSIINFANGRVKVVYHNDMAPLRIRYNDKNGKAKTVEQYIADIEKLLLPDEHIEIDGPVINVYKKYKEAL